VESAKIWRQETGSYQSFVLGISANKYYKVYIALNVYSSQYLVSLFSIYLFDKNWWENKIPSMKNKNSLFFGNVPNKNIATDVQSILNENFRYKFEYLGKAVLEIS